MKKLINSLVAVMMVFIIASCAKKGPEAVAEKFLDHFNKKEYAEAKKLGTKATQDMISMLEQLGDIETEPAEEVKIEGMKCTVEGEKATCNFTKNGEEDTIMLMKEENIWKVHMPKEMPDSGLDVPVDESEVPTEVITEEPAATQ